MNRNKLMRRSILCFKNCCCIRQPFLYIYFGAMRLAGSKPCNTSMRSLLTVKLRELLYLFSCLVNIAKLYLPVGRKFFFNGSVYFFGYCIFQRVAGLCHADLSVLFLQKLYIILCPVKVDLSTFLKSTYFRTILFSLILKKIPYFSCHFCVSILITH